MKIGLLSDTHGYLDSQVLKHFAHCDQVWHAGDIGEGGVLAQLEDFKPLKAVYGNIDGAAIRAACPEHQRFTCEGLDVWITHIGGYPPKYNPAVRKAIQANPPGLFICGHSHILKVMPDPNHKNLLHINPGAAGRHGFHQVKTIVRFEINQGKIENLQVIELGKRGK